MAVANRTQLQIINAVADMFQCRVTGTATAATTTLVTVPTFGIKTNRTDANAKRFEGNCMYLEGAAANVTPNPNEVGTYSPSAGTFVPAVTYANDPADTLVVDVYTRGISYTDIKDAMNECLRQLTYHTIAPLTRITDGDMETSGTSSWSSSNATISKVATARNFEDGTQGMRVLATAALGYAQSATILVDPSYETSWFMRAWVRADIGTARLIAYDVTNSADIDSVDWTSRGPGIVDLAFALPATCEALAFRLESVASADDSYWDDVIAYPLGAYQIHLPEWVTDENQIRRVLTHPFLSFAQADARDLQEYGSFRVVADQSNPIGMFKLVLDRPTEAAPLWLEATRPYSVLSADSDTTAVPRKLIEAGTAMELCRRLQARPGDQTAWRIEYHRRRDDFKRLNWIYTAQQLTRAG